MSTSVFDLDYTTPVPSSLSYMNNSTPRKRENETTAVPEDDFCWDFFEMYYKMTGSSAKLDQ